MIATLHEQLEDLVIANRILAREGVVDGFGHISMRHPRARGPVFHVAVPQPRACRLGRHHGIRSRLQSDRSARTHHVRRTPNSWRDLSAPAGRWLCRAQSRARSNSLFGHESADAAGHPYGWRHGTQSSGLGHSRRIRRHRPARSHPRTGTKSREDRLATMPRHSMRGHGCVVTGKTCATPFASPFI